MRIRVYHITILHGDTDVPCTCRDTELEPLLDALPNESDVADFILQGVIKPCEAPVTAEWE